MQEKREIRSRLIEPYLTCDSDEEIIGIDDVNRLAGRISKGELSARDVTEAYIQRPVSSHSVHCTLRL